MQITELVNQRTFGPGPLRKMDLYLGCWTFINGNPFDVITWRIKRGYKNVFTWSTLQAKCLLCDYHASKHQVTTVFPHKGSPSNNIRVLIMLAVEGPEKKIIPAGLICENTVMLKWDRSAHLYLTAYLWGCGASSTGAS